MCDEVRPNGTTAHCSTHYNWKKWCTYESSHVMSGFSPPLIPRRRMKQNIFKKNTNHFLSSSRSFNRIDFTMANSHQWAVFCDWLWNLTVVTQPKCQRSIGVMQGLLLSITNAAFCNMPYSLFNIYNINLYSSQFTVLHSVISSWSSCQASGVKPARRDAKDLCPLPGSWLFTRPKLRVKDCTKGTIRASCFPAPVPNLGFFGSASAGDQG